MENRFSQTLKVAREVKSFFKCLSCNVIPFEPYFTGICVHLLCKKCITKSNSCPICKASFYQKELHVKKMVKDAIFYTSSIIDFLNSSRNDEDLLPDIDITLDNSSPSSKVPAKKLEEVVVEQNKIPDTNVFRVPDLPKLKETLESQMRPTRSHGGKQAAAVVTATAATASVQQSQSGTQRISSTNRRSKKKQISNTALPSIVENSQSGDSQSQASSQNSTQFGSRRSAKKNNKGESALHLAVMNKDIDAIKQLLDDTSTDVNAKDLAGWTPLHEACGEEGSLEIMKLLIDHGADVNAQSYQKSTPLHEAALNRQYEFVEYLLSNCAANANVRDQFGIAPKDLVKNDPKFTALFEQHAHNRHDVVEQTQPLIDLDASLMGADHLNISSTYRSRSRSKATKTKTNLLFGTGMNDGEKLRLNQLAAKLKLKVAKEMNNDGGKTCNRTLNYMKAILMGIWIVNIKWLEDSISNGGVLLEENDYEAEGSIRMPLSGGPFNGRKNASCQYAKLFEDCNIFLHGEFKAFEKNELTQLVQLSGARILKREPKIERIDEFMTEEAPQHLDRTFDANFSCTTFILYELSQVSEIRNKYLLTVRPGWLFACIDQFAILHPDDPRLKA